ncbi:MAG: hypothetical protein NUW37_12125 [Planctomycetes bacterium]|nr:hypothetical protein [Planctomycetota bacterium]
MHKQEQSSDMYRRTGNLKLLICDPLQAKPSIECAGWRWTYGAIDLFDLAVDERPELIVLRFPKAPGNVRDELVALCRALSRNSHTREIPVLAVLHEKHRFVMDALKDAGVRYVRFADDRVFRSNLLVDLARNLRPEFRVAEQLKEICPYIRYQPLDESAELRVCGAYRSRLVLGGERLLETCESKDHVGCPYFLSPRGET